MKGSNFIIFAAVCSMLVIMGYTLFVFIKTTNYLVLLLGLLFLSVIRIYARRQLQKK